MITVSSHNDKRRDFAASFVEEHTPFPKPSQEKGVVIIGEISYLDLIRLSEKEKELNIDFNDNMLKTFHSSSTSYKLQYTGNLRVSKEEDPLGCADTCALEG